MPLPEDCGVWEGVGVYPISTLMVSHKRREVCGLQQTKDETGWKDKKLRGLKNSFLTSSVQTRRNIYDLLQWSQEALRKPSWVSTDHLRSSLPGVFVTQTLSLTPPTCCTKSLSVNRLIPVNREPTKPDKQLQVKQAQHLKDEKFNVIFEKWKWKCESCSWVLFGLPALTDVYSHHIGFLVHPKVLKTPSLDPAVLANNRLVSNRLLNSKLLTDWL